jgi:NADH-quinone oxidoreductase subunit N
MTLNDVIAILPLAMLGAWAVLLMLVDLWIPAGRKGITAVLAALGLVLTLGLSLSKAGTVTIALNGMLVIDGFAIFLDVLFLASGLAAIALAYDYLRRLGIERGEYYPLMLLAILGMMLMTYAEDLLVVFLALELLSIPLYILAGFARLDLESEEAALKYFLMGSFSSAVVLFGIALLFGASAHTSLSGIVAALQSGQANLPMFLVGAALLLVGFSFKSAIVPFHMWTPDVYQGSPSSVTAFMSVGAKAAGFAALLRVFVTAFPGLAADLTPLLWGLAALTMLVGNLLALTQSNIKRLMAYSSIAQSGYLLMAFVPYARGEMLGDSVAAMLFFLVSYSLTTLGAWAVIIAVEKAEGKGLSINEYAGVGRRYPLLGIAMTVFMLSAIGVPPTLGFWGKFYLFRTALAGGFTGLALVGVLTSLLSAYYYLRVVVVMFMQTGIEEARSERWLNITAALAAAALVLFSLFPGGLFNAAAQALIQLP